MRRLQRRDFCDDSNLAMLARLYCSSPLATAKKYSREFVTPVAQYARVAETEEAHQKRLSWVVTDRG